MSLVCNRLCVEIIALVQKIFQNFNTDNPLSQDKPIDMNEESGSNLSCSAVALELLMMAW